jgi:hypothetical protein
MIPMIGPTILKASWDQLGREGVGRGPAALLGIISLIALPRHGGVGGDLSAKKQGSVETRPIIPYRLLKQRSVAVQNRSHPSHRWANTGRQEQFSLPGSGKPLTGQL